ncbi:MAG: ComF family protein [Chloroflexota bacterium]|nr:ComF family protein [Chloroflexota bacterium]
MLKRIVATLVDVVYPPLCAGCDCRGTWACDRCLAEVPPLRDPVCPRCGMPSALDSCQCALMDPCLDSVRSALPYQGWVAAAIQAFKYRDETARAQSLASWLTPWLATWNDVDALIAVPLHPRRHRQRGYNQAELLVRELSRASGVPVLAPLIRTRHTPPQVGTDAEQRRHNVTGAFALRPGQWLGRGGRFVLVDDVRTTSATLGACAAALLPAGPAVVSALTIAWAMPPTCQEQWNLLRGAATPQPAI